MAGAYCRVIVHSRKITPYVVRAGVPGEQHLDTTSLHLDLDLDHLSAAQWPLYGNADTCQLHAATMLCLTDMGVHKQHDQLLPFCLPIWTESYQPASATAGEQKAAFRLV